MARTKGIDDELLLQRLTEVFQSYGYEGASLGRIAKATGLQRASLYHRFPGGKAAMAEAVLDHAVEQVGADVLAPLRAPGTPRERLEKTAERVDAFYWGGKLSCLLDSMSFGAEGGVRERIEGAIAAWVDALSAVGRESGLDDGEARTQAADAVAAIQGGLVLSRATRDREHFRRAIQRLPGIVLGEEPA